MHKLCAYMKPNIAIMYVYVIPIAHIMKGVVIHLTDACGFLCLFKLTQTHVWLGRQTKQSKC